MLLFGIVQVPVMLGLALVLALLFRLRASALLSRSSSSPPFLPYAIPGIVASILWSFLYLPGVSPVVAALQGLGLPSNFLAPGSVLRSIANIVTLAVDGL